VKAIAGKVLRADFIGRRIRVLTTINLDHEPMREAEEIDDVPVNRLLPPELITRELARGECAT
jgi:hypothetical protein